MKEVLHLEQIRRKRKAKRWEYSPIPSTINQSPILLSYLRKTLQFIWCLEGSISILEVEVTNLTGWLTYRARRQEYKDCRAHPPLIYMMSRGENINNKECHTRKERCGLSDTHIIKLSSSSPCNISIPNSCMLLVFKIRSTSRFSIHKTWCIKTQCSREKTLGTRDMERRLQWEMGLIGQGSLILQKRENLLQCNWVNSLKS